jgi:hypothetical protein
MAGAHRHYDLLPAAKRTDERLATLAMSQDYLTSPWAIFTRKDTHDIHAWAICAAGPWPSSAAMSCRACWRRRSRPSTAVVQDSTKDALLAVSTGRADAYVGNLLVTDYLMQAHGITTSGWPAPPLRRAQAGDGHAQGMGAADLADRQGAGRHPRRAAHRHSPALAGLGGRRRRAGAAGSQCGRTRLDRRPSDHPGGCLRAAALHAGARRPGGRLPGRADAGHCRARRPAARVSLHDARPSEGRHRAGHARRHPGGESDAGARGRCCCCPKGPSSSR